MRQRSLSGRVVAALGGVLALGAALACSSSSLPRQSAEGLRAAAAGSLTTGSQCQAVRLSTEPDLFGWDSGSRGKLVSIASQGLAVVSYEQQGCDVRLSVLGNCLSHKSRYEYRAYSEAQRKIAKDELELYASFPVAVAELRGQLREGRGVRADYRLAGVERVPVGSTFQPRDLEGQCQGATHVVSAIYRGVFSIGAGAQAELNVDASLLGGSKKLALDVLDHAGDPASCALGGQLQAGCDVPLRLELTPIDGLKEAGAGAIEADDALPVAEQPEAGHRCPARMAALPGGTFFMGADTNWKEQPVHKVTLSPFCLDLRETTVAEYERCVESGVCSKVVPVPSTSQAELCLTAGPDTGTLPRNCVSFGQARRYCDAKDKRLPTEAEFEFAARGGTKNFLYPWGNAAVSDNRACYGRQKEGPCPVASYPPGAFGLWDMAGNLDEWVWDWFGRHGAQPERDPTGPVTGFRRVVKGGSYFSDIPLLLRGSWRNDQMKRAAWTGFRCARDR
jgi:formylglycine-generating enzyme required for sulfatase activity